MESALLYGAEIWTLTKSLKKQLDGCCTRMLRVALNVSWKSHTMNTNLYQELPKVTLKIQQRRMRLAGHCIRHTVKIIANKLVLWQLMEGRTSRRRRKIMYVDVLLENTGMERVQELSTIMEDCEDWRKCVDPVVGHLDR